jgi:hypothetical protein
VITTDKWQSADRSKFIASPTEFVAKLHGLLSSLQTSRNSLRQPVGVSFDDVDVFLVVGFARKFLVTVLHAAFLLGLGAYSIARLSVDGPHTFAGLIPVRFSESWFAFASYSFLTLVAGETGILASSEAAQIWVVVAKLTSLSLLVILVATFSILSRDRARQTLSRLEESKLRGVAHLERRMLELILTAQAAGAVDSKAREVLFGMAQLETLPDDDKQQWVGALALERLITSDHPGRGTQLEPRVAKLTEQQRRQLRVMLAASPVTSADELNTILDTLEASR